MKRVLFFLESLAGGGAEKVLSDIVNNLDPAKYDITVCTITDGDVYQDKVCGACKYKSFLNIEDYRAGGLRKLLFWLKIKLIYKGAPRLIYRWFIRDKYDIEVAFIEGFATKLIAASNNSDSRKIAWVHIDMQNNTYADKCYRNIAKQILVYKKYQKIICVSQSVKNAFEEKFRIKENTYVQYNPVDENKIIELSKQHISLSKKKSILLGTIGRLEHQKGYDRLLQCVKQVAIENIDFEIWIIGDGSQRKELEEYIKTNNLDNIVTLLGFQQNPYKYIRCCDAFICSSYAEGFSTAATESLILGKPIFTVDCAGMNELIGDSQCGEVVPNTDVALLELLRKITKKDYQLEKYKKAAAIRGQEFRMSVRIAELENLLDE